MKSIKLSALLLALIGFISTPAMACGGDKDKDDDYRPQDSRDISAVFNCGDKDKDDDKDDY